MIGLIQLSTLLPLFPLVSTAYAAVNYSDTNVQPDPIDDYERYLTVFGNGTRTYVCDPKSGNDNFTLADLNYNLYYAEPTLNLTYLIGRRVFLPVADYNDGDFAFYTKVGAFTYWVGKVIRDAADPGATGPTDLPAELELVTERSEPKPGQTELDLGVADYVTRYGAVGGLLPQGTKCNPAQPTIIVPGSTYYSFWTRTA